MDTFVIPADTRDLRPDVLSSDGRMRILPAEFWKNTTVAERARFGAHTAIYSFPTVELIGRLKELINNRPAIEIGAGHGVVGEALGITATDSFQQNNPYYRMAIVMQGQKPVQYGYNVMEMHASRAVRRYKPEVVVACWVTHKWDPRHPEREGNEVGVDERDVILNCQRYIFVGNEHTHRHSRIWDFRPHVEYPDYVFSRATTGKRDFIAVVDRPAQTKQNSR